MPATLVAMRQLIKNASVVLPTAIERVSVVIEDATNRRYRSGAAARSRRSGRRQRTASAARRDRRPGPFPRAGPDAQRGSRHREPGVREGRRHHVSGNAEHRAGRDDAGAAGRKARAGRPQVARQLRLLHRCHDRQCRRAAAGPPHARHQDLHRLQHGRPARRRAGRAGAHLRRNDAARSPPIAKTKRPCGPTPRGSPARTTWPITRAFAITRRRSSPRGGRSIWPIGTGTASTCCTFRPAPKPSCWPTIAASSPAKPARIICCSTSTTTRGSARSCR